MNCNKNTCITFLAVEIKLIHMLANFSSFFFLRLQIFSKLTFSKNIFQEHYQSVKQFWFKLFVMIIRQQNSTLASKELRIRHFIDVSQVFD